MSLRIITMPLAPAPPIVTRPAQDASNGAPVTSGQATVNAVTATTVSGPPEMLPRQLRWRIFGHVPFLSVTGPDVSRSAMGRLAGELCFVPAAALSPAVRWEPLDHQRALACVDAHGWTHRATLTVAESGRLERVDVPRWGNPDGKESREHLFTALMDGPEETFDGFTVPTSCRAGWWHCPDHCADQEFIRFTLDHATYQ